jgi:hypothetical protein
MHGASAMSAPPSQGDSHPNLLERLFGEERRRTKVVSHAFGERPVLKLMYAAVIRAAHQWRGLSVSEFEQRQLKAIREELDRAHTERTSTAFKPTSSASPISVIQQSQDLTLGARPGKGVEVASPEDGAIPSHD